MIIDFHCHVFPDNIAQRAIAGLRRGVRDSGLDFEDTAYSDGTVSGLAELMDKSGTDHSVLLPVATKPSQPDGINKWTREVCAADRRFTALGAFYPEGEKSLSKLEKIKEQGFKGIKLHGDFQGFYADDGDMIRLYRKCSELGLIVVMHSGLDFVSCNDVHVTPERMARVLDKTDGVTFVLAHMGGVCCEDRAAKLLAGAQNVYVDTAYTAGRLSPVKMRELICAYGADKVLFGSDSPWNDPSDVICLLEQALLPEEKKEKQLIFYENAVRLLKLDL